MKEVRRKRARRKNRKGLIIFAIIIALLLGICIFLWTLINGRLSKLNKKEIDKEDLEVNVYLQEEVKGLVTKDEFEDIVTIALFGSDSRDVNNMAYGRADSIIIASLNPKDKSIKLISIPRDTYVNIPGYGMDKINHSYAYGGEQLLIKTINNNFGLAITEYATVDFLGLANIINALGGIELDVSQAEVNIINDYLKEIYALEGAPYQPMTSVGRVTLTGEQAVAHCRDRYVGTDFDRQRRQREVITATIEKASKMSVDKMLGILDVALAQITTNIDVTAYLGKITNVFTNISDYKNNIISKQIPNEEYGDGTMINGVYYFAADLDTSKKEFANAIYSSIEKAGEKEQLALEEDK